jgi:MSHA pilin protein MshD
MSRDARRRGDAGVTLVELVIAMAAVSIALAGLMQLVAFTARASADPLILAQAAALAESTLEEVTSRAFFDPEDGAGAGPCPPPETSRALFDNVCDYHGLDDAGARDQTGAPLAGLSAYRVRVAVDAAAVLGGQAGATAVLRVDVRVTHPAGLDVTLSGYRTSRS